LFSTRGLPEDDAVKDKISSMMNFFAFDRAAQSRFWHTQAAHTGRFQSRHAAARANAYLALDQLKVQRAG
jgi:hypothetical protein